MTKELFSQIVNSEGLDRLNRFYKVVETHALMCGMFCVTCIDEPKELNAEDMSMQNNQHYQSKIDALGNSIFMEELGSIPTLWRIVNAEDAKTYLFFYSREASDTH